VAPPDLDVRPLQSKGFTAAEAESQCHDETCPASHVLRRIKNPARFLWSEGDDFILVDARSLRDLCWIFANVTATHSLIERDSDGAVHQVDGGRLKSFPFRLSA